MQPFYQCCQCGKAFYTQPLIIPEHDNALVCSKECKDGYERFMETVREIEEPQGQMNLPFGPT
jgi:hypothetical protein